MAQHAPRDERKVTWRAEGWPFPGVRGGVGLTNSPVRILP